MQIYHFSEIMAWHDAPQPEINGRNWSYDPFGGGANGQGVLTVINELIEDKEETKRESKAVVTYRGYAYELTERSAPMPAPEVFRAMCPELDEKSLPARMTFDRSMSPTLGPSMSQWNVRGEHDLFKQWLNSKKEDFQMAQETKGTIVRDDSLVFRVVDESWTPPWPCRKRSQWLEAQKNLA